jgi:hypothetical protein
MNHLFKDTDFYTILQLLPVPDDIKHKILLLLLGLTKTPAAARIRHAYKIRFTMRFRHVCGFQYEVNEPPNSLREAIMCEIRIVQFDAAFNAKKQIAPGAIKNIIRYKELLAKRFKQRYIALFK